MDPTPSQHQHTESAPGHPGPDDVLNPATAPHAAVDLDAAWTAGGYRLLGSHGDGPAAAQEPPDQPAGKGPGHLFDRSPRRMAAVPLIVLALVIVLVRRPLGL